MLKGARTVIAGPEKDCLINPTAVSSLATAGSGDVLAGIIGSLMGRGLSIKDASAVGVFVHGCAGELSYLDRQGPVGTIAGDLIAYAPGVINGLLSLRIPPGQVLRRQLPGSMHFLRDVLRG